MRALLVALLLPGLTLAPVSVAPAPPPAQGECGPEVGGASLCIYRSLAPSIGIVTSCRDGPGCRVGHYYGDPRNAVWFSAPPGLERLPPPEVVWLTSTLAQVRLPCGHACSWSYFFEVTHQRLSEPRRAVLATDSRRLLFAGVEARALVVRQIFSGREVARIERDWAPGEWPGDAITAVRFDLDGRLSFTWLRGRERSPVSERVSVPSVPRS